MQSAFWQHIKALHTDWQSGNRTEQEYQNELVAAFAKRAELRKKADPVLERREVATSSHSSPRLFPHKNFLDSFHKTYDDEKCLKHEIANPFVRPQIDRLDRRRQGIVRGRLLHRGDIVSMTSFRTQLPSFAQIANIFVDADSEYFAAVVWLQPTVPAPDLANFNPAEFRRFMYDEQMYRLDSFAFVAHRPIGTGYRHRSSIYRQIHRKYRKQLKMKIRRLAHQRARDLEADRPEDVVLRPYPTPHRMWIERAEILSRNKSGFTTVKRVLRAGKQTRDSII